jgi:ectoine hydroxylase-related dioxygenase (phytanoyl-CoA dioxygenase family)
LDEFGYCVVANALAPDEVAALRDRLSRQADAERQLGHVTYDTPEQQANSVNQWVFMLANKGRVFRSLLRHPLVSRLVEHVLGPDYLLSEMSSHITHPDNELMGLHIDQWWLPQPAMPGAPNCRAGDISRENQLFGDPTPADRPINPPVVANVMWAANDFTIANGATRIVPRSHLSGCHPDPARDYETVSIEVPAGSAIMWEGRTWHAAGFNRSNGPRYGIVTYYCAPQFRQMNNYTYGLRPEVRAELTPAELDMFGFRPWSGYGHTGEVNARVIKPGAESLGELD